MIEKLVRGQMVGLVGALAMLVVMGGMHLLDWSPGGAFLPTAVVTSLFDVHGSAVPLLALLCHFTYAMAWGIFFVSVWPGGRTWAGVAMSFLPWLVLVLLLLPLMNAEFLTRPDKPRIALSALWMHLWYGVAAGWTNGFVARRWKIECRQLALQRSWMLEGDGASEPAIARN